VLLYWFTSNVWTLLQQMYINRYHPPKAKEVVEVGTVGKTLAPKPGQRPARDARTRPAVVKEAGETEAPAASTPAPRSSSPRPGQRPQRQGGARPPGKRPSQAKRRR